ISDAHDINLRTGTSLTLNQQLNADTADIRIVAGTTVTQVTTGFVIADELGILAGGDVTLCAALTNDVNTLAINTTGMIEFRDVDELVIGTVIAGGNCGFTGATGLVSNGGNINLNTGDSNTATRPDSLQLDATINAGGGDVRIVAGSGNAAADRSVDQAATAP